MILCPTSPQTSGRVLTAVVMPAVPLVSSFAQNFRIAEPWAGVLAPAKTPDAVISVLNDAMRRATEAPRYKTLLEPGSYTPYVGSPTEFRAFLDQNISDWRTAAQAAGVKAK
jgi:tripartite-type tricarboxylate transporter receptor subunit TctC